jgi:hypothetical protein
MLGEYGLKAISPRSRWASWQRNRPQRRRSIIWRDAGERSLGRQSKGDGCGDVSRHHSAGCSKQKAKSRLRFKPETFEWHAVATLATWAMTLVIQCDEHRDTQAIHAKLDEILHALGDAPEMKSLGWMRRSQRRSGNGDSTCVRTTEREPTGRPQEGRECRTRRHGERYLRGSAAHASASALGPGASVVA